MQRITANLKEQQMERLAYHSKRTGASQSELLRRALDVYLAFLGEEEFRLNQAAYIPTPTPQSV